LDRVLRLPDSHDHGLVCGRVLKNVEKALASRAFSLVTSDFEAVTP
jgi:hypothetical protein